MRTDRQCYKDSTYATAISSGYDVLQLKFDGWWARLEITAGQVQLYSRTGRLVTTLQTNSSITGTYIGEYLFGTQWSQHPSRQGRIVLFDVWRTNDTSLETYTYRDRFNILRTIFPAFGVPFELVVNYPIVAYDEIWKTRIETAEYEGVVFRRRLSPVDDIILRCKATVTEDVQITGFQQGLGKHSNRLGALLCQTKLGIPIAVGGGLDDKAREDIWQNQTVYLGRWCTIEGRARFESGAIRHPNFVCWRDDLNPQTPSV